MRGRDFSPLNEILSKDALTCLEMKGEDSILVHNKLSEMYFESVWNVKEVRKKFQYFYEQLIPGNDSVSKELYNQMIFDLITFYNIGNGNQLYKTATAEWIVFSVFSIEKRRTNNRNLSAFLYIQYFYNLIDNSEELRHLLFANCFIFGCFPFRKEELEEFCKKCCQDKEEFWSFIDYAIKVTSDFYQGTIQDKEILKELMIQEAQYFLSMPKEKYSIYMQYIEKLSHIVYECEYSAYRQKNYGLVDTELDELFENVI
ncbi:MAG TPA: hypothetical protein DCW90_11405 [Lachnospiraceae bacterium]|nr:hypothetical protein [uncultured Lachnoclostridium sp.]HAU86069.1 hypothetical protein [Lachnospiraceae bacterium]